MKLIYNNIIPFKGFYAINLFGLCFVRKDVNETKRGHDIMVNHESIHTQQMREIGYIFFYVLYVLEWFVRLFINGFDAYSHISFEREAYENQDNFDYIKTRKRYSWVKHLTK